MSSGFVSENSLEEARQKRQDEWEKVRKAEDPKDVPEEPYDHRSLFERLEENKRVKDAEHAQLHDIKNVVRGIDDDEAAFLDKVDEIKSVAEIQRIREERKELEEYKKMQEKLMEENEHKRLKDDVVTAKTNQAKLDQPKKTQSKLLSGVLVRKRSASNNTTVESKSSPLEPVPKKIEKPSALAGLGDYGSSSSDDSDQDN